MRVTGDQHFAAVVAAPLLKLCPEYALMNPQSSCSGHVPDWDDSVAFLFLLQVTSNNMSMCSFAESVLDMQDFGTTAVNPILKPCCMLLRMNGANLWSACQQIILPHAQLEWSVYAI